MGTTIKKFTFDTGPETMVNVPLPPSPPLTFAWLAGDSPSGPGGCVHFTTSSNGVMEGRGETVGNTWETWGVPPGATVLSAQVTEWFTKVAANGLLTAADVAGIRIVDAHGDRVYDGNDPIDSFPLNTTVDVAWQAQGPGLPVAILPASQPSATPVQFVIDLDVTTSGGGSNVDIRFDSISLAIVYSSGPIVSTVTLVQQNHNTLRYLIEYDGSTPIPNITSTGAASPDLLTDSIAGPLKQCAQAFTNGLGLLPPGPITQTQARAIWMSDNPSLVFASVNGPRSSFNVQPRLNPLANWTVDVDVDVDGGGHPYITIFANAAGKAYLEIRSEDAALWVG